MEVQKLDEKLLKEFKQRLIYCKGQKKATFVCFNPQCQKQAFMCVDDECSCKQDHKCNLKLQPYGLSDLIEKKLINSKQIMLQVNRIVDRCIDWLSQWRDQVQVQLKYYGLTTQQKQFISSIHSNKFHQIKGKNVFPIVQSINKESSALQVQKAVDLIKISWQKEIIKFDQIFKSLQNIFSTSKHEIFLNIPSTIVTERDQINTLKGFFQKKIKSFKFLYRASQNQFEVQSFFHKCAGIPHTLVLVRTSFDKKIGGYTPMQWSVKKAQQNTADPSKQSFIFSLTNNDKFDLVDQQKAIQYYDSNCGPRFGGTSGASDLTIKNKANENQESYSLFNNCYVNEKYKKSDISSYRLFTGSDTNFYKIKEWEVFQVQFA